MEPNKTAEPALRRRLVPDTDKPFHPTILDDPHAHHLGGRPYFALGPGDNIPIPCGRFPDSWQHLYDGDLSNLEIDGFTAGFDGGDLPAFSHVRCYESSNVGPCRCGRYACHTDSLIVAVDGACPYNGLPWADKSACGIYFGPNNPHNMSFLVLDKDKLDEEGRVIRRAHTNQRAELRAVAEGLEAAKRFCEQGGQWDCQHPGDPCQTRHVVVKSDSAYVVDAMAGRNGQRGYAEKWVKNNFRNFKGEPVKNKDLWCLILWRVVEISMLGATVDFWLVPRAQNQEADALANKALGGNRYLHPWNGQLARRNITPADVEGMHLPMSEADHHELGFSPVLFDSALKYLHDREIG